MSKVMKVLLLAVVITGVSSVVWNRVDAARRARPVSASCFVDVTYEFRNQVGTVTGTEHYQKAFIVEEGVDFVDDFSTPTRQKVFTASLQRVGGETIVSINWFADVSVFNSVDLNTTLKLPHGRKPESIAGDHTFSSTPGHATTSYLLMGARN